MKKIVLITLLMVFAIACKSDGAKIDKAKIHGAMNQYIQNKLAAHGGVYNIGETKTTFDYIHSGVREKEGLFLSCADFKAGNDVIDVDFYVKDEDGKYTVVKEVYHKKNGKVITELLWQTDQ